MELGGTARVIATFRRPVAGRLSWGVSDQALSSLTNFLLGIAVARATDVEAFGLFTLAFATGILFMGASRACTSDPLVTRYSVASQEEWRAASGRATGAALAIGVVGGLVCGFLGVVMGGTAGRTFIALGVALPGLLVQDCWRYAFFAARRGRAAFANDLLWTALLLPALIGLMAAGSQEVGLFVLAWGASASVAGLVGCLQAYAWPRPVEARRWFTAHRELIPRYAGEFVAMVGTLQLVLFGVGALAGLDAVGALRAGFLLLGPMNVLIFSVNLVAIPEFARFARHALGRLTSAAALLSAALGGAALAWGAVLILIPRSLGVELLGQTWDGAAPVIAPLCLAIAASGVEVSAVAALRGLAAARESFRARLATAPVIATVALLGAGVGGAVAAASGLALGFGLAAAVAWFVLVRTVSARRRAAAGDFEAAEVTVSAPPSDLRG